MVYSQHTPLFSLRYKCNRTSFVLTKNAHRPLYVLTLIHLLTFLQAYQVLWKLIVQNLFTHVGYRKWEGKDFQLRVFLGVRIATLKKLDWLCNFGEDTYFSSWLGFSQEPCYPCVDPVETGRTRNRRPEKSMTFRHQWWNRWDFRSLQTFHLYYFDP